MTPTNPTISEIFLELENDLESIRRWLSKLPQITEMQLANSFFGERAQMELKCLLRALKKRAS